MTKETMEAILEESNRFGLDLCDRPNYEGRYGVRTCGIVGSFRDFLVAAASAAASADGDHDSLATFDGILRDLGNIRQDNMGKDFIFY